MNADRSAERASVEFRPQTSDYVTTEVFSFFIPCDPCHPWLVLLFHDFDRVAGFDGAAFLDGGVDAAAPVGFEDGFEAVVGFVHEAAGFGFAVDVEFDVVDAEGFAFQRGEGETFDE